MINVKNKKAFTIIELIGVIAIIGILMLFGMPKLLGYVEKAQLTRIQHDTKIMQDKMESVLSEQNNSFNDWNKNAKDLGILIMKKQLFETGGIVRRLDKSHIKFPKYNWANFNGESYINLVNHKEIIGVKGEMGMGGPLVVNGLTENTDGYGYKIIPNEYKSEIKTKLKGTFYSNGQGKVYYEPDKSIKSVNPEINPNCSTPEILEYEFHHETGTIVKYLGTEQNIIIPSSFLVKGQCWPVRIIGAGAYSRGYPYPKIKEVILPPGLENIEDEAFKDNGIEEIIIPPGVEDIGDEVFNDNPLEDIIIQRPEDSINMGNNPFGPGGSDNITYRPPNDKDLGVIVKPKRDEGGNIITGPSGKPGGSIYSGGNGSSGSWGGLGGNSNNGGKPVSGGVIIIPPIIIVDGEEVEIIEINKGAFQGEGLIHVILPNGLQRIEDYAFAGNQLIGVDIPQSVKHIGNYAFAYNELYDGKDYKWTLNYIDFEEEKQFDKVNEQLGNIEESGLKIDKVKEANLLDHIWVNSNSGFIIPDLSIKLTNLEKENIMNLINSIENTVITSEPSIKYQVQTLIIELKGLLALDDVFKHEVDKILNKLMPILDKISMYTVSKIAGEVIAWTVPANGYYELGVIGGRGGTGGNWSNGFGGGSGGTSGSIGSTEVGLFKLKGGSIVHIYIGPTGYVGYNHRGTTGSQGPTGQAGNGGGGAESYIKIIENETLEVLISAKGGQGGRGGRNASSLVEGWGSNVNNGIKVNTFRNVEGSSAYIYRIFK